MCPARSRRRCCRTAPSVCPGWERRGGGKLQPRGAAPCRRGLRINMAVAPAVTGSRAAPGPALGPWPPPPAPRSLPSAHVAAPRPGPGRSRYCARGGSGALPAAHNMAGAGARRGEERRAAAGGGRGGGALPPDAPPRAQTLRFQPGSSPPGAPRPRLGCGGPPAGSRHFFLAARRSGAAAIMAAREPLLQSIALGRLGGGGRLQPAPRPGPATPAPVGPPRSPLPPGAVFRRGRGRGRRARGQSAAEGERGFVSARRRQKPS